MYQEKLLWPLSVLLIIMFGSLGVCLYILSVPIIIYVAFTAAIILVFVMVKLHRNTLPSNIVDGIASLTKQLKGFETGKLNDLPLGSCPKDLIALSQAINSYLKLESDRITHEQMFSSEASHELRTPLAGIRIQAQIAQRTKDPQQQQKALNSIIKTVDKSTRLVQQLLTFSRLTKRRTDAERSNVMLSEILNNVVESHNTVQEERHISLSLHIDATTDSIKMESHGDHLAVLFDNLYTNALNHTPQNGVISLSLTLVGQQLSFVIEDSGTGIQESDYERVVIPFQKSQDGRLKGSGLGLAICDRIASLHGGRLIMSPSTELKGLAVRAHLIVNVASS
ncbi:MAG: two-component system sensor histidine kinase QseC [Paraglaciecola sp.]|jgi:two-component system sensor histidine kinase QseC